MIKIETVGQAQAWLSDAPPGSMAIYYRGVALPAKKPKVAAYLWQHTNCLTISAYQNRTREFKGTGLLTFLQQKTSDDEFVYLAVKLREAL